MLNKRKQELKKYIQQRRNISPLNLRFFNFWSIDDIQNHWFHQFVKSRNISSLGKKVNFYSVMGSKYTLKIPVSGPKIFFTGENLQNEVYGFPMIAALNNCDLGLGFEYREDENYLRFPLWLLYLINPTDTLHDIREKIEKINRVENRGNAGRQKFASLICRNDHTGIRAKIADELDEISPVEFAGDFRNNTSELQTQFGDNKLDYLRQFRFNICPENTDNEGYVTEKLLEAFQSGCIPIYWGSAGNPEHEIFNQKSIVFFDKNTVEKVKKLWEDNSAYQNFIHEKPFLNDAPEKIWDMLNELEMRIKNIINA